jgi:CheY-like chemotaxis protein
MDPIKERVLIVDDDDTVLFLFSKALERNGQYEVVTAPSGLQAMQLIETSPPFAVLLTDMMMPFMSGLDLAYKARQIDPHVQVVVITAAGSVEIAIAAMRDAQVWDYLLKPLPSLSDLNLVVERAIAQRRLIVGQDLETGRLRALISVVREGVLVSSFLGRIQLANPAAEQLLGRSDLTGCRVSEVLPPCLLKLVNEWLSGGQQPCLNIGTGCSPRHQWKVSLAPLPPNRTGSGDWVLTFQPDL